jgi:hypothetical protein
MGQSEYAFCFGNFIKEVGLRFSLLALVAVYYNWITVIQFVYVTAGIYFLACIITMFYAFYLKSKVSVLSSPNVKEIMIYTFLLFYPAV